MTLHGTTANEMLREDVLQNGCNKDIQMPDTIHIFHTNSQVGGLEDLIADLYGPDTPLGAEAGDFIDAADGKRSAAVQWNGAFWVFDRERSIEWATGSPSCHGETLSLYLDPATDRYGYSACKDGKVISARHGEGRRFEVTRSDHDRGYEHRQVSRYWQDAPQETTDIIYSGGILPEAPPHEFRNVIVLTALQTYTGAAPFGEHKSFFQGVPVRPVLTSRG